MKILSWNIERLKSQQNDKIDFIKNLVKSVNPDIIFLTETNLNLSFGTEYFQLNSIELPNFHDNQKYENSENRISIFSKYEINNEQKTYDNYTAICAKIITEFGELQLYGSIIGSFGGKDQYFENDLENQKREIEDIEYSLCFSGDLNISFSGFKYPSQKVIEDIKSFFEKQKLEILTKNFENCAIHIIISKAFLKDKKVISKMVKIDRKISDHHAIICEIN